MNKMKMNKINVDKLTALMKNFSGAEIKSTATEAGYFAIRNKRTKVKQEDLEKAIIKVKSKEKEDDEYKKIFG